MKELLARVTELGCPVAGLSPSTCRCRAPAIATCGPGLFGAQSPFVPLQRAWDGITHPGWAWDVMARWAGRTSSATSRRRFPRPRG
jgi:hypothetical protein